MCVRLKEKAEARQPEAQKGVTRALEAVFWVEPRSPLQTNAGYCWMFHQSCGVFFDGVAGCDLAFEAKSKIPALSTPTLASLL